MRVVTIAVFTLVNSLKLNLFKIHLLVENLFLNLILFYSKINTPYLTLFLHEQLVYIMSSVPIHKMYLFKIWINIYLYVHMHTFCKRFIDSLFTPSYIYELLVWRISRESLGL